MDLREEKRRDSTSGAENAQAGIEWHAWGAVCVLLEREGVRVNHADRLVKALVRWGEELAKLRALQETQMCADALAQARAASPHLGVLMAFNRPDQATRGGWRLDDEADGEAGE